MENKLYTPNMNGDFVFWFCFPAINSFALSALGYLWLLKEAETLDGVYTEKITTDTEKTKFRPSDVDLMAFSMSFDFDFLNVFKILEKYKIPFKSSERNESFPLIFAGGPVVSANPKPYKDFFDFFIIGDGEETNNFVIKTVKENKEKTKNEILKILSEIEGVYVPQYPKAVQKLTKSLDTCIYSTIISNEAYFKNTFIIEIERGCSNCCRFCLASFLNLPVRHVKLEKLKEVIDFGLTKTNKIAFLGAQVSAHPDFEEICNYIDKKKNESPDLEMNFSSLRVDAITPNVIKLLKKCGQKTVTLAIEAGSERLRNVINKNITKEQIFSAIKIIKENGLKGVKFYGIIGLPTETEKDIDELIDLGKQIKKEFSPLDITFGFSTFIPKPHTPFQWCGREDISSLEKKIKKVQKEFNKSGINTNFPSIKQDLWQAVLSRGDGTFTDFLIDAYKDGGKSSSFKKSAKLHNIDAEFFGEKQWDTETELPWDFIELKSPPKEFLKNEFRDIIAL